MKTVAVLLALLVTVMPARTEEALDRVLDGVRLSVDFEDAPLDVVLDYLRDATRLNIVVHPEARDASPDAPRVSLRLENASMKTLFRLVLRPRNLEVQAVEGVLLVVPRRIVEEETYLKMYDVRDLLAKRPDFAAPEMTLPEENQFANVILIAGFEPVSERFMQRADHIVNLVRRNCGGTTWDTVPGASIGTSKSGMLLVNQSRAVHAEIEKLLNECRRHQ